jgi:magnesium transporter
MKPTLLHGIAAPSPSVLNFLRSQVRNAFESPVAQCTGLKRQQRGYGANNKGQWSIAHATTREAHSFRGTARLESRTVVAPKCCLSHKSPLPASAPTFTCRSASQSALQSCAASSPRMFSTSRTNNGWNIFKSERIRRLAQLSPPRPPPEDSSQGSSSSGFGSSLGRIMRPANELKMRCTELDEHGNVTLVSGEFKKSELIAKVRSYTEVLPP